MAMMAAPMELPGMMLEAEKGTTNGAKPTEGSGFMSSADAAAAASTAFASGNGGAGALRAAANRRTLQRKVQGLTMIGHIRRQSIIASTYGTEMTVAEDRNSLGVDQMSAISDHGATFAGRERTGSRSSAVKDCCDK